MENELSYSENNLEENFNMEEYVQGFNGAYLLATYEPALFATIIPSVNPISDYEWGLFDAKQQLEREQGKNQLNELEKIRNRSRDQEHDLEKEA